MPVYHYRCKQCQAVSEHTHGMQEIRRPPCPACGGLTERILTQAPPVLGGTASPPESADGPAHECHSTCALHRYPPGPAS